MIAYILRRTLYAVPIILGVNVITFIVFFFVNDPDNVARTSIGRKHATLEAIEKWKRERNYHLPYFYNDGWQQEAALEVPASGWIKLPSTPAGDVRISIEMPHGAGAARLTLACNPAGSILPGEWAGPADVPAEMPEGYAADATTLLSYGRRTEILELSVTAAQGADLQLHASLPDGLPQLIVRAYRREDLGFAERFTQTLFVQKSLKFLLFDFGKSDRNDRSISGEIGERIRPSLSITVPMFLLALIVEIAIALFVAYVRGTYADFWTLVGCIALMSISIMFYVIFGQWLMGKTLRLLPVSGFDDGVYSAKFVLMPVLLGLAAGLGAGVRLYRTFFLEEINRDYVRTARMKGIPDARVLTTHVLKNAMIPIMTGAIVSIPFLLMGTLILESFFAVPGMGSYTIEAIAREDFPIVQAMTFLGSLLYIVALLLTDIAYTLVDPRVRLQ